MTAETWAGTFGTEYTARNRVDWRKRVPFWCDVLAQTGARSVYEVGCNAGWNLSAIQHSDHLVRIYGCEVNQTAAYQARLAGFGVDVCPAAVSLPRVLDGFDLVFTAGVLIHIPPAELEATMQAIVNASADYVLAVEYSSDVEEEILYRGQPAMLWRRPYGRLYEALGLKPVRQWDAGEGFDRCTAFLLRK